MPEISIVMGVYNTPIEYLDTSIESILNQSYCDFEFIIVDDGSSDLCKKRLSYWANRDKRIILLLNEKNMGLAFSLNKGINASTGKYIARMDSDDYCSLDRLEKQVEFLEKNDDVHLVSSNVYLFDDKGIWGERCYPSEIYPKLFYKNSPITHPTIMVRKCCINEIGNYLDIGRTYRCEDFDLFCRFLAAGFKIKTMDEKLYYFREDENSSSRRKFKYRINGFKTRIVCYKKMKILFPFGWIFAFRTILVGFIPKRLLLNLRRRKEKVKK